MLSRGDTSGRQAKSQTVRSWASGCHMLARVSSPPDVPARGTHFVQSLERGLAVVRAFDASAPEATPSDVARAAGLPRAAARRFLLPRADLGSVRTDGRLSALSPRVLELGYASLSSLSLPEVAEPHL